MHDHYLKTKVLSIPSRLVSENVMRNRRIAGHIIPVWLVGIIVISAFAPAMVGNSVTTALTRLEADNASVPISAKAARFLLNYTYNSTLGLCSEVYGNGGNSLGFLGQVFWIISDNLLAYYALQLYDKTVSDNIKNQIETYAKNYSLPTDPNGLPISFKHETILGDTLPAGPPHGYTRHNLTQKDSYLVVTEVNNGGVWLGWMNYSDELAWMAMSDLNQGNKTGAEKLYYTMMNFWDGYGFADAPFTDPNASEHGSYQTYKVALAIILRERLELPKPPVESTMEDILAACQQSDGGIATGYNKSLSTVGQENTETTALVVIANVSKHVDVQVGLFYYVWYQEGLGNGHWNSTQNWTVVDTPVLGFYSSSNVSVIKQHLDWFRELGINFLIISWWGSKSLGAGNLFNEDYATNLVFKTIEDNGYPIKVTLMVEAFNDSGTYDFKAIYDYIYENYATKYGDVCFRLNNDTKPLVCWFNDDKVTGPNGQPNVDNIRKIMNDTRFDARIIGQDNYVNWTAWNPSSVNSEFLPQPSSADGFICIEPRYDDSHIGRNSTFDPTYSWLYDEQWRETLRLTNEGKVNYVAIYSWNEYHERSQIEPHISPNGTYVLSPFSQTYHYIQNIQTVPEFPSLLVVTLLMTATFLTVIVLKRKQTIRTKPAR